MKSEELGQAFRELRAMQGRSQRDVASKAGISQPSVSAAESGQANTTIKTLEAIAESLGMRLEVALLPSHSGYSITAVSKDAAPAHRALGLLEGQRRALAVAVVERIAAASEAEFQQMKAALDDD